MYKLKLQRLINYSLIVSLFITIGIGIELLFEVSYHHILIKSFFFFGFASIIFSALYLLYQYCAICPISLQKNITYVGLSLVVFSGFVWYNIFNLSDLWNIMVGMAVLFILVIELQMLGWASKQKILVKFIFLLALLSNLFISFVFCFEISLLLLYPYLITACILSIFALFYGLYLHQPKKPDLE